MSSKASVSGDGMHRVNGHVAILGGPECCTTCDVDSEIKEPAYWWRTGIHRVRSLVCVSPGVIGTTLSLSYD